MNTEREKTGLQIKNMRQERGWSREKLARKSDVSTSIIYKIENALTDARVETINKIYRGLGIDIDKTFPVIDKEEAEANEIIDLTQELEELVTKLNLLGLEKAKSYILDLLEIKRYSS